MVPTPPNGSVSRRRVLQLIGVGVAGTTAGCGDRAGDSTPTRSPTGTDPPPDRTSRPTPTGTPDGTLTNGSFESGLDGWAVGTDLPEDPENPGHPVEAHASPVTAHAAHGQRAIKLFIDGRQDDGTIWVQQSVDFRDVETLAVVIHSPGQSFNTITKVAAYAGPSPAKGNELTESDFNTERSIEDHDGWKGFEYPIEIDAMGIIAVGISVVWETEVTRYLDNIRVR